MKKLLLILLSGIIAIVFLTVCILYFLTVRIPYNFRQTESSLSEYSLKWDSTLNKKQSRNSCGSYSSMAFLYEVADSVYDPEYINSNMPSKMKNNYTFPWGVTTFMKRQGVKTRIYWFGLFNDEYRIRWIKNNIEKGVPVILIVGNKRYLHYITILGYSGNNFYIYDSNLASDENGDLAGNTSKSIEELFTWWKAAWFKFFNINLAISTK
jgi:hypothetical protein